MSYWLAEKLRGWEERKMDLSEYDAVQRMIRREVEQAVAAERELCAKIAEQLGYFDVNGKRISDVGRIVAAAIRKGE